MIYCMLESESCHLVPMWDQRVLHSGGVRGIPDGWRKKKSLTQSQMCGHTSEDECRQERQGHDEAVEEPVVALSDTVPHPRTVMVETLCEFRKIWWDLTGTVREQPTSASQNMLSVNGTCRTVLTPTLWTLFHYWQLIKCLMVSSECIHSSPTQLSHRLQWDVRGGRNILQVKQYLSLTTCWLRRTSLVRGGGR